MLGGPLGSSMHPSKRWVADWLRELRTPSHYSMLDGLALSTYVFEIWSCSDYNRYNYNIMYSDLFTSKILGRPGMWEAYFLGAVLRSNERFFFFGFVSCVRLSSLFFLVYLIKNLSQIANNLNLANKRIWLTTVAGNRPGQSTIAFNHEGQHGVKKKNKLIIPSCAAECASHERVAGAVLMMVNI